MFQVTYVDIQRLDEEPDNAQSSDACDIARGGLGVAVIRLSLGRRLVNLLPVAQRSNAFTNGVVGRTMGRWS